MAVVVKRRVYHWSAVVGYLLPPASHGTVVLNDNCELVKPTGELPQWRELIRKGHYAGTDVNGSFEEFHSPSSYFARLSQIKGSDGKWYDREQVFRGSFHRVYESVDGYASANSDVTNEAKSRLVEKIRDANREFQGGVFLGELRQTIQGLKNPLKQLRKSVPRYLDALRKRTRGIKKHNQAIAAISGTYLEWAFGIKPLLGDIDDASRLLRRRAAKIEREFTHLRVFVEEDTAHDVSKIAEYRFDASQGPNIYFDGTTERFDRYAEKWQACVGLVQPHSRFADPVLMGFDPTEWIPSLYAVMPWSWLIDYFSNLGDVISAHSLYTGHVRWVMRTRIYDRRTETVWTCSDKTHQPQTSSQKGVQVLGDASTKVFHSRRKFTRARFYGSLIPELSWTLPGTSTQFMNMAALAGTKLNSENYLHKLRRNLRL